MKVLNVDEYREFKQKHTDFADLVLLGSKIDNAQTSFQELLERFEAGYIHLDPEVRDVIDYSLEELLIAKNKAFKLREELKMKYEKETADGRTEE